MDELVKRLRAQAVYLPEKFSKNAELLDVLMKAADAIEELTGFVQEAERDRDEYRERLYQAADVRPVVKAEIVDMRYTEDDGEWKCSHCGWQFTLCVCGKDVTSKIHFCPNCGADMRPEPPKEE